MTKGLGGFQGINVRNWCQDKLIPVADFTRAKHSSLPDEPDLFGMRVPTTPEEDAITFIIGIYRGFTSIRDESIKILEETSITSISAITAAVLGRPDLEPNLSLYFSRLASSKPWPSKQLQNYAENHEENIQIVLSDILSYIIGHVLQNLILAFPGPLMNLPVLAAYLSILKPDANRFTEKTDLAVYKGPFCELEPYYWRSDVDTKIEEIIENSDKTPPEDLEYWNRFAVEEVLGSEVDFHECGREGCNGKLGGFWCPFTKRPVCLRNDCSEPNTAWIPDGADLCRVEKDFFDEFAPLLGL